MIDIFRRLPDDNTTLVELEKAGKSDSTQSGGAKGEQIIREEIMPQLERLIGDEDVDVRYYASTAGKGTGVALDSGDAMET